MTQYDSTLPHVLYLALGTNLGDKRAHLLQALDLLGQSVGEVRRVSAFLETEPWGFSSTHTFLNAACMVHTILSPMQCLEHTQLIEKQMGRTAKSVAGHYQDRVIDIDLLLYDDLTISTPQLTLPHPLMMQREFVTLPLSQVMPADEMERLRCRMQTAD